MTDGEFQYFTICAQEDLPPGERLFLDINQVPVVVFNINGSYYAMDDVCTHDDGPLGEGELEGFEITCPRHGARFDVRSGKVLSPPAVTNDRIYPIMLDGNDIKIGIPK
jgi:3-phenylpropionate/trans-cinnamate dioxygenase ferredoxin component